MKNTLKTLMLALAAGLFASSSVLAAVTATGTTTMNVSIANEAAITVTDATTNLTTSATDFSSSYTGITHFSFKIRTTQSSGNGTITVQSSTDLTSGADTIAAGDVTFTSSASAGAAQTGTLSKTAGQNVTTFGADAHSASGVGNSSTGQVNWTLPDKPEYKTGTYSTTVTFTVSAS